MKRQQALEHAARITSVIRSRTPDSSETEPNIFQSWCRCVNEFGIDPVEPHETAVLESPQVHEIQDKLSAVLQDASDEMQNLYGQISGSGYSIILTDPEGAIVNYIGDPTYDDVFRGAGLWLGALWTEAQEGTNGIGTCAIERRPVTVHQDEHFRSNHIGLSCSAAPVFDAHGELLAILDASTVDARQGKATPQQTLRLVSQSARLIQNRNFQQEFQHAWLLRFHNRIEYVGLLDEAMLAVSGDGLILGADENAATLLGYTQAKQLIGQAIDAVFDIRTDELLAHSSSDKLTWPIREQRHGLRYFASVQAPKTRHAKQNSSQASEPQDTHSLSLENLGNGDPLVRACVDRAQRIKDRDIPILITGETGTGKEVLARAIHAASARRDKPFVAVNCAAIPESLIESELFGYAPGAFTGARRGGMRGKFAQANGGTLFLDEIGDMPLTLQTRLLRILEENKVTPLGSEQTVELDLHIITASHCNLGEMIEEQTFREDLYYRLNGVQLDLPALRAREDIEMLVRQILANENNGRPLHIETPAMQQLCDFHWPGNIRQLRNTLKTALALSDGNHLTVGDLPTGLQPKQQTRQSDSTRGQPQTIREQIGDAERVALIDALESCNGVISATAKKLGVSRNTLYRKMKAHNIRQ